MKEKTEAVKEIVDLVGPPTERHMVGPRSSVYALHLLSRYGEIQEWQVTGRVSSQTESLVYGWRTTKWNQVALFHQRAAMVDNKTTFRGGGGAGSSRLRPRPHVRGDFYKRQICLCGSAF